MLIPQNNYKEPCGAFYNVGAQIGSMAYGIPSNERESDAAAVEMMIARVRMNYCARTEKRELVTREQMDDEVRKFLKDFRL